MAVGHIKRAVQSGMVQSKEKTMAKHASQQQTARVFLRMPPADAGATR